MNIEEDQDHQKRYSTSNHLQVHQWDIQYPRTITHQGNIILQVIWVRSQYYGGALISIPWLNNFDQYLIKLKRVQEDVYIVDIIKGLVNSSSRDLNNKFYTLVIFGAICWLIWSGKAGYFYHNLVREAGVNNLFFMVLKKEQCCDHRYLISCTSFFTPLCASDRIG